jgi:hypothetical protein
MKHKDQPLFDKKGKPRMPGQIGETKVTLIDKQYDWGIYVWKSLTVSGLLMEMETY